MNLQPESDKVLEVRARQELHIEHERPCDAAVPAPCPADSYAGRGDQTGEGGSLWGVLIRHTSHLQVPYRRGLLSKLGCMPRAACRSPTSCLPAVYVVVLRDAVMRVNG